MVRIIERSTLHNKEPFDKLWAASGGHTHMKVWKSHELMSVFARALNLFVIPWQLDAKVREYVARYPYTMLSLE